MKLKWARLNHKGADEWLLGDEETGKAYGYVSRKPATTYSIDDPDAPRYEYYCSFSDGFADEAALSYHPGPYFGSNLREAQAHVKQCVKDWIKASKK